MPKILRADAITTTQPAVPDFRHILCSPEVFATTLEFARPDVHIGPDESASPTIEVFPGIFALFLSFDVRNNSFSNVTMVPNGGIIGRHRHRGSVVGITLEGSWRYLEYDWVARPGSYIHESPGVIHTLEAGPGMKTFFAINGALEYFDADGNLTLLQDVFWAINLYLTYCKERSIPKNDALFT
jgi:2,4'-dihydroxyacetophenone dioxygenase